MVGATSTHGTRPRARRRSGGVRRFTAVVLKTAVLSAAAVGTVVLGGFAAPALAHHGGTGDYDASRPIYLSGTVIKASYGYPHAVLQIRVPAKPSAPADLGDVWDIRGREFWQGEPVVEGAGQDRELLLPPDITGTIGSMDNRPGEGDTVSAIAYRRCDGDEYDDELRVQLISFAGERLKYEGTITRITDGCPTGSAETESEGSAGQAAENRGEQAAGPSRDAASDSDDSSRNLVAIVGAAAAGVVGAAVVFVLLAARRAGAAKDPEAGS
ncbi:DUF6152 family protein [Actinopolymorpha alba]|uniref:DUF6152 family protein n=1 Tax=Actinopolymorpha alba TaxID=533267 RepID=UPI0003751128|nr:DUF6152 family protein [Actinopolymorpha alba]